MSTHSIQKYDNFLEISLNICFLELSEKFPRDKSKFKLAIGKGAIGVQVIKVF